VSFFRHGKIYRSDLRSMELNSSSMDDHRYDESSTGYSLTGCSPAEPLSASPIFYSFSLYPAAVYSSAANANLSLLPLSHRKGAPQCAPAYGLTRKQLHRANIRGFFQRARYGLAATNRFLTVLALPQ